MIKYARALQLGTAEAEQVLRRFTRNGSKHPTYLGIEKLGRAIRTILLCEYLSSEALRRGAQPSFDHASMAMVSAPAAATR